MLLLSCDAGRSGGMRHRPSGLAGAFLAAGAREVVALPQPVGLATAEEVGPRLISAFMHSKPLARGLAEALRDWPGLPDDAGPQLGRTRDPQRAAAVFVIRELGGVNIRGPARHRPVVTADLHRAIVEGPATDSSASQGA